MASLPSHLVELYEMTNRGSICVIDAVLNECACDLAENTDKEEDKEILKEIRALEELKEHMEKVTDSKARALSTALVLAEDDDYETSAKVLEESDKVVYSF